MHLHKQFDRAGAGRHQLLAHRPKVVPHLLEWCTAAHLESQLIAILQGAARAQVTVGR